MSFIYNVVKSLLQYYNRYNDKSFESILSSRDINQGLSLFDIEEILSQFGIKGSSYEVDNFELLSYEQPIILVVDRNGENHYILSYERIGDEVVISDSLRASIANFQFSELKESFRGYAFLVESLEECNPQLQYVSPKIAFGIDRKLRLELFYLTTLVWLIPISVIFSIQYFLIYQLRNLLLWQVGVILLFELLLVMIYLQAKIYYEELVSDNASKNQEILTLSFLAEIDNINTREENIYNRLIKFWNNFNAADCELKRFLVGIEMLCLAILDLLTFLFSREVALLSIPFLLCFVFIFNKKIQIRKNDNKMFFNSLGELSIFVE